jgi:serine protease
VEDDSDPTDLHGHGTHVAGIAAAATNNGVGIAGMSWGAMIMPVRVLDKDGWGSYEDISNGITWAATHGADILNLSLGGTSYSQAMQDAVNAAHAAGVLVVAAMGNDRGTNSTNYPAACTNVMAVAAANIDNRYANYSQYGAHCDIAAPGGEMSYLGDSYGVFSTLPTYDCTFTTAYGYSKNYDYLQGTSQAAPFVSGLAAIFRSIAPSFTPDQVQALIQDTATDLGPAGWDQDYGWGRINAAAALSAYVFADGFEFDNTSAWSATVP